MTALFSLLLLLICTSAADSYVVQPEFVRNAHLSFWMRCTSRKNSPNNTERRDRRRNGWCALTCPRSSRLFVIDPTKDSQNIPFFGSTNAVNGATGEGESFSSPSTIKPPFNTPSVSPSIPKKTTAFRATPVNDPVLSMTDSVMEVFSSFGKLFQNILHSAVPPPQTEEPTMELPKLSTPPNSEDATIHFQDRIEGSEEEEIVTNEDIHMATTFSSLPLSTAISETEDDFVVVELDAEELDRWNAQVDAVVQLDAIVTKEEVTDLVDAKKEDDDILMVETDASELDRQKEREDSVTLFNSTELSETVFPISLEKEVTETITEPVVVVEDEESVAVELDSEELDQYTDNDASTTTEDVTDEILDPYTGDDEDGNVVVAFNVEELDRWNAQKDSVVQLDATISTEVADDIYEPVDDATFASNAETDVSSTDAHLLASYAATTSGPETRQAEILDPVSSLTSDVVVETVAASGLGSAAANFDDEDEFSMDDLEASILLAQQSLDGSIAGLSINFDEDDASKTGENIPPTEGAVDDSSIDPEQLAIAARLAVEAFERNQEEEKQAIQRQREVWSSSQVSLDSFTEEKQNAFVEVKAKKEVDNVSKWNDMTVNQLKAELETLGLPKTGTKSKLIARLEENQKKVPTRSSYATEKSVSVADVEVSPVEMKKSWSSLRVSDLKSELLSRGLPTTGKKADLVLALEQSDRATQRNVGSTVDSKASIDFSRITDALVEDAVEMDGGDVAIPEDDAFQDMEALARAAREAVALFEESNTDVSPLLDDELVAGDDSFEADEAIMDGLFDDDIDIDIDDLDLDALEKSAREAVLRLETDDDEPSDEALWEIENEILLQEESTMEDEGIDPDLLMGPVYEDESPLPLEPPANYARLAVSQLKEELNRRGLRVTGKKIDLIARLEASDKAL